MLDPSKYASFCSEFYIVEKTIEVVVNIKGESQAIRIEALFRPRGSGPAYSTRAYIEEMITVQMTYPQWGQLRRTIPNEIRVWADYHLPWTLRDTADDALEQALGFLSMQCDRDR